MNNKNCFLLSIILLGLYALNASAAPNPASKDYVDSTMIGRAAYGGIVFFTYYENGGVHGLVASTADEPGGTAYDQAAAISQCANKVENGYNDWFLPTKAQMTALLNNRFAINPNDFNGGFAADSTFNLSLYWSSSPTANSDIGWYQNFGFGDAGNGDVTMPFSVRCVRKF